MKKPLMTSRCLPLLVTIAALSALFLLSFDSVHAQSDGPVQILFGSAEPSGGRVYQLPGLQAGQTLYVFVEGTSGNLDPITALTEASLDVTEVADQFFGGVREAIAIGEDPLVALPAVADTSFLAWDDDSGPGHASAFAYEVPADGDYSLIVSSTPTLDTGGGFRLLIGLDAPQVLTGQADATGDVIAVLDTDATAPILAVQELTGTLTGDTTEALHDLSTFDPDDTLYVFVEATSGDLAPTVYLEDFSNKPVRTGNFLGQDSEASLQFTFDEPAAEYRLRVVACCEDGPQTEGDYRLLLGLNVPEVLTGSAVESGQPLALEPFDVQIGVKMQQITGVDQKEENFGVVASLQMRWQDPALAFNPDSCQCRFKTFTGASFASFANQNSIIWPEFSLFNQQGNRWTQNDLVVVYPDGQALFFERFTATLQAPDFDFRRFPFDMQQFFIRVDSIFPVRFVAFSDLPGFSDLGVQLGEEEWIVTDFDTEITTESQTTGFPASRFSFRFEARRHLSFYIIRIFIPIFIILLVSWFTFFLKDYGKRVDVSAGNLLLLIAFNFTISGDLPRLGYLTFLDTILISTFVVTGLVVMFNVALKRLEIAGRGELAQKIDRYTIWIYPVGYLIALVIVSLLFT